MMAGPIKMRCDDQSAGFSADFLSDADDVLSVEAFSGFFFEAAAFVFDLLA